MSGKIDSVISFKIRNIMDLSLIEEASRIRSIEAAHVNVIEKLRIFAKRKGNALIICDLSVLSREEAQAVTDVARETESRTFGYYPHISDQIRLDAKTLGFNFIVPRSALRAKMNSVLA